MPPLPRRASSLLLAALTAAACAPDSADGPLDPALDAAAAAQPAERCTNVADEGQASLGVFPIPAVLGGGFGFGALPFPVTIGSIEGDMLSWITAERPTGTNGQGALHLGLHHGFLADDGVSWFLTEDRAVCAPGSDATTCRVNDVLQVVAGAGAFAGAGGSLRNHGIIDFATFTLSLELRGRVCGDGV